MPFKWGNPGCPCCTEVDIPPLPDCSCPTSDCFPPGKGQPSSIKVEIEYQDSLTVVETNREQPTSGACGGKWITSTRTKSFSGASGFNGTYDIGYYLWDGANYIPADPLVDPCGYWFYPLIETELTVFDQLVTVADDNCVAGSTQTFADWTVNSYIVINPTSSTINNFPLVTHPGLIIAKNLGTLITIPQMVVTQTQTPYACTGGGSPIVTETNHTFVNGTPNSGVGTAVLTTLSGITATGLRGRLVHSGLITVGGQQGRMFQYAKNGDSLTPCEILHEEGTRILNAYNYSVAPTRREYNMSFPSYQVRTKVIFNA